MADIYLDACCFVYLVEGEPAWQTAVRSKLSIIAPSSHLVTSQLARLECRTKPLRDNDRSLLERYDSLFTAGRVLVLDISSAVIDRATEPRARHGLRTPDAIHVATAIEHGAEASGTGDAALSRCTEVPVKVLKAESD